MKRFNCDFSTRFRILKGGKISLVISALLGSAIIANAAPTGGVVTNGTATISQSGNVTNINQSSNKSIINWQKFNVNSNETVNINMPSSTSTSLNRIVGNEASSIYGVINSNGQVFLVNQNGVYFGKDSQVNTAGFVATTKDIKDEDFLKGNYVFEGNSNASIINFGTITTPNAYTALLAKKVENEGVIKATLGQVHLASGDKFTLDVNGNSLLKLTIDKGVIDGLVSNKGAIIADGGEIYMTTSALGEVLNGLVNNTGLIQANSVEEKDGKIILFAHGGTGEFGGTIEAKGGFVETSGKEFVNKKDLKVKADKWLIDPVNITIDSTLAGTISDALTNGSTDVEVNTQGSNTPSTEAGESGTGGDIFVNSAITWNSANALWLVADRNIYINSAITATNDSGKLYLYYGQNDVASGNTANYYVKAPINLKSGQNFTTHLGNDGGSANDVVYTVINGDDTTMATALQAIELTGNYALGSDLILDYMLDWTPIGTNSTNFTGKFDGLGHTISNLTISLTTDNYKGLFGYTGADSIIRNIGLLNANVKGGNYVGGLVGENDGTIFNSYVNGQINGEGNVGGLAGYNYGSISNSYFIGGWVMGNAYNVGGLVGFSELGTISNSYSTGSVQGSMYVGGLVGLFGDNNGVISNSYSTASVIAAEGYAGGLVGSSQDPTGTITNSYSTGNVKSNNYIGGLVGNNSGTILTSYSTGIVSVLDSTSIDFTNFHIGGLVGNNSGTISNSFYDNTINAAGMMDRDYGKTTVQFTTPSTFSNFDRNIWSLGGVDATVAGYQVNISRPYITALGKDAGITSTTLFEGGYGTSENPYTITTVSQLQNMNNSNVVSQRSYYYNLLNDLILTTVDIGSSNWTAIGTDSSPFKGKFDGLGHTISNLTIDTYLYNQGLFGYTNNSEIRNIGLLDVNILGGNYVGGLVGYNYVGSISNAYVTGRIKGNSYVGGLLGNNIGGAISNSYSIANVRADNYIGGLVGNNDGASILNSYSTGIVSVRNPHGIDSTINIGGLVGNNNGGSIINSFYDNTVNPAGMMDRDYGKTTAELQKIATYTTNITDESARWNMTLDETQSKIYPYLVYNADTKTSSWTIGKYATALNYSLSNIGSDASVIYNGTDILLSNYWTNSIFGTAGSSLVAGRDYKFVYNSSDVTSFKNAGTYNGISVVLLNADYELNTDGINTNGNFTIAKKDVTVSGLVASGKTYDGTNNVTVINWGRVDTGITGEYLTLNHGTATFDDVNAGTQGVTASGYSIANGAGGSASNYNLRNTTSTTTANIAKKDVTASGLRASGKTYDGTNNVTVINWGSVDTGIDGETLILNHDTATFDDVNAGTQGVTANGYSIANGTNGKASNYNLRNTTASTTAEIAKKALIVTAQNDSMVEESKIYKGGNGVTYSGFVENENQNVLGGTLTYNGSSQGAKNTGDYVINPNGLTSNNYDITYKDGKLTITPDTTKTTKTEIPTADNLGTNGNNTQTNNVDVVNKVVIDGSNLGDNVIKAKLTIKEYRDQGTLAIDLKTQGYKAVELKDGGYGAKELKDAGYSINELKDAGFSADELKAAGFSSLQLKRAGF